ncbi:RNA 2',3'-cyclic phosphodiesterase [uncultured Gimesia sp.]|uniref:RNA 2',3'-cyclic phosphodiesterase n=1 Tax=uncultured Gimesia sp. TaxID=1678688 RepID=UPI0026289DE1|nr:RNA 2',3'-cyclic phosphodiesterase [uncultured Gimesia sp.]
MRTFIAVPIHPPRGLRKLLPKLEQLGPAVKPIAVDQMHITLKFLGTTELEDVMPISSILKKMRSEFPRLKLAFKGLGAFPRVDHPNVIWAGISDATLLTAMVDYLEQETEKLGYPLERKGFHPHLTLARVNARPADDLFQILQDRSDAEWGEVTVDTIKFYQSEMKSQRAQYHEMQTVKLYQR